MRFTRYLDCAEVSCEIGRNDYFDYWTEILNIRFLNVMYCVKIQSIRNDKSLREINNGVFEVPIKFVNFFDWD